MTSFIGFAGSEDLGNGLKAEFALESFIGNDTGATVQNNAGNFWGRASNVAATALPSPRIRVNSILPES